MTCGAGALLTSLRGSLVTSRRRSDGGGKNPTAAALGFRRGRGARGGRRRASRVSGPGGGRQLIRAWGDPLACTPRTGRHALAGLGWRRRRSPKQRRGHGGDDGRDPRVSDPGRGRREAVGAAGLAGGPRGWLAGPQDWLAG
jgi:hypothetical protein